MQYWLSQDYKVSNHTVDTDTFSLDVCVFLLYQKNWSGCFSYFLFSFWVQIYYTPSDYIYATKYIYDGPVFCVHIILALKKYRTYKLSIRSGFVWVWERKCWNAKRKTFIFDSLLSFYSLTLVNYETINNIYLLQVLHILEGDTMFTDCLAALTRSENRSKGSGDTRYFTERLYSYR